MTSFFPLTAQSPQAHGTVRAKRLSATRLEMLVMHVATSKGHQWITTPDGKLALIDL